MKKYRSSFFFGFCFRFRFQLSPFRVYTHNIASYSIRILNISVSLAFAYNPQLLYVYFARLVSSTDAICIYCQVCTIIKLAYFATKRNGIWNGCENTSFNQFVCKHFRPTSHGIFRYICIILLRTFKFATIQIQYGHTIFLSQSFALLREKTLSARNFPGWWCGCRFPVSIYFFHLIQTMHCQ